MRQSSQRTSSRHPAWRLAALGAAAFCAAFAKPSVAADNYTQTRYPVVLVHGLLGFDQLAAVDYFYAIPQALRAGGATVFTPSVPAANTSEVRGEQLLRTLRSLKATYGYTKFNLVGHSQGGETTRYVAAVAPELVASVTTVGTSHDGSKAADALDAMPVLGSAVLALVNGLASVITTLSGAPQSVPNAMGALQSLDTPGSRAFNVKYPQGAPTTPCGSGAAHVNGVNYYSVGGTSVLTNPFDITDAVLLLGSLAFGTEANDGLVGQCSSHWGTVLKDNYRWNHLDEINHAFGLRGLFSEDPVAFYRSQVNRLKTSGL